jgi:hypothetical protein
MIRSFLESLEPDQHVLFHEIAKHVTDDMLAEIAGADYPLDADVHLAALRLLRDKGELIEPFYLFPCEVLELIRNSQPDNPEWKPGGSGVRGHWLRAFSSAALLRALGSPWEYNGDAKPSYTLIQLIRSLASIPLDLSQETIRFLAWLGLHEEPEGNEQSIYVGVALLWLTLQRPRPPSDEELIRLSEWIVRREEELRAKRPWAFDRWLLGIAHDPPPSAWETVGSELMNLELRAHQPQLQEWVKLIGSQLSDSSAED